MRHGEAQASTTVEVFDLQQLGSLYERIVQRVVKPDTERQAPWLSYKVHPWFPVLLIGAHKAELYTRALVDDIVHKRQNLADPGWLTRVGLYLELMTALGVIEAVRDDLGDLLTPEERAAADRWDDLTINVDGWRGVWALRKIAPADRAAQPAGQEEGDARVPARPPRGPQARDRARRAEPHERAGDLAPRVPRRRARRAVQDAGRVPRAGDAAGGGAASSCSGTGAGRSACDACCACPGRSRSSSATRTGCSRPPATSTARR